MARHGLRIAVFLAAWTTLPGAAPPDGDHVFVVTADPGAGTGSSAAFDLSHPWQGAVGLETTGPDVVVRHFFGLHYVVHRSSGMIQVIDPASFDTVLQFSVGEGSNPHDILVVDTGSAYVSRHASPFLHEVDPATGALVDVVDLGGFADADGIPEMSMMALDRNHLFIQIQRLDPGGAPVPPSYLAVVDVRTNQLVDPGAAAASPVGIRLTGLAPSFKMQVEGAARRLYVSEPGVFHDGSGGIEVIDLDNLTALGFLTSEAQVSLDITGFVLTSPVKGYVVTHTDLALSSHLQPFSRIDGSALGPELHVSFAQVNSLAHDPATDQLYFPDPDADGVRVFDATTQEELSLRGPVPTGPDPVDLVLARAVTPGEATDLRVTSVDATTGELTLSYAPACGAADHTIVLGPLEDVGTYSYTGQVCGIGSTGGFAGFDPGAGSVFFLVVGNDGAGREGSYGVDSSLAERPEDAGDPVCSLVRDLALRCDG